MVPAYERLDAVDEAARKACHGLVVEHELAPVLAFQEPLTQVAWRTKPTTYIVTEQDAIFPVPAQEALAAPMVRELDEPLPVPVAARSGRRRDPRRRRD